MARYTKDLVLNKPDDFVHFLMNDFLKKNQFIMADWKGEPAYRTGDAMMEGYKYLKWTYFNGVFHLEAWMKGTFGGEWNLDGFVGCANKKPYRESLEQLFDALQQEIPMEHGSKSMTGEPQMIPVRTVDNRGAANMALVFGTLSLVLCWLPLVSILLACLGFSRARMGSGSSLAKQASVGKILCITGTVLAIILWVLNILMTAMA